MLLNLGMLKMQLLRPKRFDQKSAGPFEVVRMATKMNNAGKASKRLAQITKIKSTSRFGMELVPALIVTYF